MECGGRLKKIGFTSAGKRRFLCLECRVSFTRRRIIVPFSDFVRFYDFVLNKLNKTALLEKIDLSRTSLWRRFKPFFSYQPTSVDSLFLLNDKNKSDRQNTWILGIDGKWLHRRGVIMIYRDVTNKTNLYWSWHFSESYESIRIDFEKLLPIMKNNLPSGVVSDWKGAIISAVNIFLPPIPHQRCLSHVQRQLLTFLPLRSPIPETQELRRIAKVITKIKTHEEKYYWVKAVDQWISKYDFLLKEKTRGLNTKKKWWYTHGNLRRAVKLLKFDEKHLFAYLDYPILPDTNNSLEGVNSQTKTKLSNHRGFKVTQQVTFIFWMLTFQRVKNRNDLKELWDRLKTRIFRF